MYRNSLLHEVECVSVSTADEADCEGAHAIPRCDSLSLLNEAIMYAAEQDGRVRIKSDKIYFPFHIRR